MAGRKPNNIVSDAELAQAYIDNSRSVMATANSLDLSAAYVRKRLRALGMELAERTGNRVEELDPGLLAFHAEIIQQALESLRDSQVAFDRAICEAKEAGLPWSWLQETTGKSHTYLKERVISLGRDKA